MTGPLLPPIEDRSQYRELFKDNDPWERAIQFLIEKHQLKGSSERGVLGSHIVYRVGNCWIKLMAPLFAQDMVYELSGLRAIDGRLSIQTPKIIAEGLIENWPYVILSHVEGEAIRNVWPELSQHERLKLVDEIARITKEISQCTPDEVIASRFAWDEFIKHQYDFCEEQQKKKGLPDAWLKHVGPFLRNFDIAEFQTVSQVFLHADLTFDHFLVVNETEPRVSGVIDLADCQVGHYEYELVAPCVFILKGNQFLLEHYLAKCGFPRSELNQCFSEKLLAWSILHRYCSMVSCFQDEMNACLPGDFKSLALKGFPLSGET